MVYVDQEVILPNGPVRALDSYTYVPQKVAKSMENITIASQVEISYNQVNSYQSQLKTI